MADSSRVPISGSLEPFAAGFATELARQGYTPRSTRTQLYLMSHVSRWLHAKDVDVADFPRRTRQFLEARQAAGYKQHLTDRALRPSLAYLRACGAVRPAPASTPTGPVDETLARYRHYLAVERGLGEATAHGYVDAVRPFVHRCVSADGLTLDIDELDEADVTAFMVTRCAEQSGRAAQLTATALRSLLAFLHVTGAIARSLVKAVPSVPGRRLAGLPSSLPSRLEPHHVRRLLTACDRRTLGGRRDFAVITTLARLGLRAAEVAALRLDDLQWRAGEIVVHGKGQRVERMPLPTDVGDEIAAYLRQRPARAQGRAVFVRLLAPLGPLSPTGVTQIVSAAAQRAGLGCIHAHRLRHFAATQLLNAGTPLSEIQHFLRHARLQTTAIYAKVDYHALRTIHVRGREVQHDVPAPSPGRLSGDATSAGLLPGARREAPRTATDLSRRPWGNPPADRDRPCLGNTSCRNGSELVGKPTHRGPQLRHLPAHGRPRDGDTACRLAAGTRPARHALPLHG